MIDDGVVLPLEPLTPQERKAVDRNIERWGQQVFGNCAGQRADRLIVTYSVGFATRDLPEIMVSGVPQQQAATWINVLSCTLIDPVPSSVDAVHIANWMYSGNSVCLRRVPSAEACSQIMNKAHDYFGREVEVMQLIFSDAQNRLPWDAGFDSQFGKRQCPLIDWTTSLTPETVYEIDMPDEAVLNGRMQERAAAAFTRATGLVLPR